MEWSAMIRLPGLAVLDAVQARAPLAEDRRPDALRRAWGPLPWTTALAAAVAVGVGVGLWLPPRPDDDFSWGVLVFAALGAWRLRAALPEAGENGPALRSLLATMFLATAVSVLVAFATPEVVTIIDEGSHYPPLAHLLQLVESWVLYSAYGTVVLVAFATTRNWVSALLDLVVAFIGFWITVWITRIVAGFASIGIRLLIGVILSVIDLELPDGFEAAVGAFSDSALVTAVALYILAACWLTAVEILPAIARGEKRDFVEALSKVLEGDQDEDEESETGQEDTASKPL